MRHKHYISPSIRSVTVECQAVIASSSAAEKRKQLAEQSLAREKAKEDAVIEKYGTPTNRIKLPATILYVFEEKQLIVVYGRAVRFSDIVSCQMENKVIPGKVRFVEKTDPVTLDDVWYNRNPQKRNHVVRDPDKTYYSVVVAVNDLKSPTISFDLGDRLTKAMELKGLFDVIIARNNQPV